MTKTCKKCKQDKDLLDFYSNPLTKCGSSTYCKECSKAYRRDWIKANPNKQRQYGKNFRRNNNDTYLRHKLKKFGLTVAEYRRMFMEQDGKCRICSKHQNEVKAAFAVDHCHKTNKIRGLLCRNCNAALGLLEDDSNSLTKAIIYLAS